MNWCCEGAVSPGHQRASDGVSFGGGRYFGGGGIAPCPGAGICPAQFGGQKTPPWDGSGMLLSSFSS
jgi:hypothetical protein